MLYAYAYAYLSCNVFRLIRIVGVMMTTFDFWGVGSLIRRYDFKDKERCIRDYVSYMLCRTQSMFEYEGLPDTMPKRTLELYAQVNGHVAIIENEGNLYSLFGSWGGMPNEYYLPTEYIISNPYLNLYKTYTVDVDCVVMPNDSLYKGLMPMFHKYATQIVENDITMVVADINSRIVSLITATDDKSKAAAEKYLRDIYNGDLGVIASNAFLEGVAAQPYGKDSNTHVLTDLIEYHQYLRANWFNELGLDANYNMKRESIMASEAQLNDDMLFPLIDDMLNCRNEAIDKINAMFGTNISVKFSSSWEDNQIELNNAQNGGGNGTLQTDPVNEGNLHDDDD